MGNVALIGLMGSGKSTLGAMLAQKLERKFIDVDQEIERESGQTIPELFDRGEHVFRALESEITRKLCTQNAVMACGGGVVLCPENVKALRESGLVVFIDRPVEKILEDVVVAHRPLLKNGPEALIEIDKARSDLYRETSHAIILNDADEQTALEKLLETVKAWEGKQWSSLWDWA